MADAEATAREPVRLWVQLPDGSTETISISGPGGTIRISIGEPGHRGGVWRIWANKSTPDVYLANRQLSVLKYSFHASGIWRHAWSTPAHAQRITGNDNRLLDRWERPEPNAIGWTRAFTVWTPSEDVVDVPDDAQTKEDVIWLPQAPAGQMTGIHVVIASPNQGLANLRGTVPMAGFTLVSGEIVLVLMSQHAPDDEQRSEVAAYREDLSKLGEQFDQGKVGAPRAALHGFENATGHRLVYDLAIRPQVQS
jgi:hypothetical protein